MSTDHRVNENSYTIIYWKYVSWSLVSLFMFKTVSFESASAMITVTLLKCAWTMFKTTNWYDAGA